MSFDINKLAHLLQLFCNAKNRCVYGMLGGFKVYFRYFPSDPALTVRVYASPDNVAQSRELLYAFGQQHRQFSFLRIWESRMTAVLNLTGGMTEESAAAELGAIVKFAEENAFISKCGTCGNIVPTKLYQFDSDGLSLCDSCSELCKSDVDRTNEMLAAKRPKTGLAVLFCIVMAVLLFLYDWWTVGDNRPMSTNFINAFCFTSISVFLVKKFARYASKRIAALSITLMCIACAAGVFMWHVDYFVDFNKDNYESMDRIITYYNAVHDDDKAYDLILNDPDMYSTISDLYLLSDSELENTYIGAKRIVANQTRADCIKNFRSLIMSEYGDKMRENFFEYIYGGIGFLILFGVCVWRLVLKSDNARHSFIPLEPDPFNPYTAMMTNNRS